MELNESHEPSKNYKKFPYEIVSVDKATEERIISHFKGPYACLVQVGPEKWIMPKLYSECAEKLYNFKARPDDIWICTFPRSGTTWTQEMMWLLCNDLNYEAAKSTIQLARFPFLELACLLPDEMKLENESPQFIPGIVDALEILPEMTSPRLIKTHLPINLMPHDSLAKHSKIVYVARNPRDVIASYFDFVKNPAFSFTGNFQEFLNCFMDGLLTWGPYFEHVKDGWNHRNDSNVLFLFYEDLVMDLPKSLKKLASFLERPLSDNDLPDLMQYLNIESFKENSSVNIKTIQNVSTNKWNFIRRGQIGGDKEITAEIGEKIDEWSEAQLKGTGMKFPHQLRHKIGMYK